MSYDLNRQPRSLFRTSNRLVIGAVIVAGLALAAFVVGGYGMARLRATAASRADAALWRGSLRPCPTMTRSVFGEFGRYAPLGINLWDTQIERRAGEANCTLVSPSLWEGADFMSCHFTNPVFLRIAREGHETFFRVDSGPATLRLDHDGAVRCIVG